ncbi:DegT/DnrJ/EryC1/StrS aminotransferase family protein [Gammaproteobacteria bacterium]|nr:DegT/DnrJ/EryC1/StrS aminotransferase family protein [Gammaproteobacteria bacterium]
MDREFIMQMRPWFGEEEREAMNAYMLTDGFLTEFKNTQKFEQMIADYTGIKHCIVVNNGTISLTLAALALHVGIGDEVIIPNYTMIATPNSIKMIGAKPVFVDVEKETLCLDLDKAKNAITNKTKAMILVSANGRFPKEEIQTFRNFAIENGIALIEDAAQALGSLYPDQSHIGSKGMIGSFSFSMPKIITTGQGGALVTNDDDIATRVRKLKDFGRAKGGLDIHDSIGFNSKFTEMQAVIGIEQLKKLDFRVKRKKEIWTRYFQNLEPVEEVYLFNHNTELTAPWFIDGIFEDRDRLISFLKENNIGSRVMYPPINRQDCYKISGEYPVSENIGNKGIWLPSYTQLTDDEIDYITDKIKEFYS